MNFFKSIVPFLIYLMFGCSSIQGEKRTYKSKIPVTKQFLSSEWLVDSIYGVESSIQEWVYFTEKDKFWRFSYYNTSYIIDSSLEVRGNKIFNGGQMKYSVYSLDSNQMILTIRDTVYHLKRRKSGNYNRMSLFLEANSKKVLLNGTWRIDSADYLPASIPSYCRSLFPGSSLVFRPEGFLDVYEKDSSLKCNSYSYQVFKSEISLLEYDMVINMEILTLSNDSLVFKSRWLDYKNPKWTDVPWKVQQDGYNIYCTRNKYQH